MPRNDFSRDRYAQMVVDAFQEFKLGLQVSPRHDIFLDGQWKVSGSAFRIVRDRAYHHGTMLLASDLDKLRTLLKSPVSKAMQRTGSTISSIVSLVKNLSDADIGYKIGPLDHDLFCQLLGREFEKLDDTVLETVEVCERDLVENEEIVLIAKDLASDDWILDKTPPFEMEFPQARIKVEEGRIVDSEDEQWLGGRFDVETFSRLVQGETTAQSVLGTNKTFY